MTDQSTIGAGSERNPWHLWAVGIFTLLWNGSGAYTFMMSQSGRLSGLDAEQEAYYAAQPLWFAVSTDLALLAAVAAGFALLMRRRLAFWLFAVSLGLIVMNNLYELLSGVSRMLVSQDAIVLTSVVLVIAVLQFVYARTMRKRGLLR